MLDPGTRKCHQCLDQYDREGVPIPDCSDPDGKGTPCPYPTIWPSLQPENMEAWTIWGEVRDQLINLAPMSSEPFFALNLASLDFVMRVHEVEDPKSCYLKVREFQRIADRFMVKKTKKERAEEDPMVNAPETKKAIERVRALQRRTPRSGRFR